MRTSLQHWQDLWQRIGAAGDGMAWHRRLLAAYGDPSRGYHSVQHLNECLSALDEAKSVQSVPNADAIEMALWFHDAVYDPKAADNEEQSARLAHEALIDTPSLVADVSRLIMSTKTHRAGDAPDSEWMIDIDLSILGQSPARIEEYEAQIRQEYAWVPDATYRAKRAEILAGFLNRHRLYSTDYFNNLLESQARHNLHALIEGLRQP